MRRALVVLNTELPPYPLWRRWHQGADLVVAADGGANRLLEMGLEPDAVVGDMDSVLGSTRRRLPRSAFHTRAADDATDLEKAIDFAVERGVRDVTVLEGRRRRLDHLLGHMAVLLDRGRTLTIRLVDDEFVTQPVDHVARFRAARGTIVSLFTPSVARGVSTRGLRWPLAEATLVRGTLGIHNEVVANPVEVRVRDGDLLVLRSHRVEPHA